MTASQPHIHYTPNTPLSPDESHCGDHSLSFETSDAQGISSFFGISHTGLSDDDLSFNSLPHRRDPKYDSRSPAHPHDHGTGTLLQTLPRLTIHTRHTKALLLHNRNNHSSNLSNSHNYHHNSTDHSYKRHGTDNTLAHKLVLSPSSNHQSVAKLQQPLPCSPHTVATTQPNTPMSACSTATATAGPGNHGPLDSSPVEEFPKNDSSNASPQFYIPSQSLSNDDNHSNNPNTASSPLTIITESFSREMSSLDTTFLREKELARDNKSLQSAMEECVYWNKKLEQSIQQSCGGRQSLPTAHIMMELGACLLRCKQHVQALSMYENAVAIYRMHHGSHSLSVARGLDRVGFAATLCGTIDAGGGGTRDNLQYAQEALKEALRIRVDYLGPHHCDCVDTLNNIAGVYLQKKEYDMAKELYLDVLHVRSKIFGMYHPSIAITAQMLGKIYFYHGDFKNAMFYYELALRVYRGEQMNLKENHPLVSKVLKHLLATEKMMHTEKVILHSSS